MTNHTLVVGASSEIGGELVRRLCARGEHVIGTVVTQRRVPVDGRDAVLSDIPQKIVEITRDQHPLGRNATLDDVVNAIDFLLSDRSGYVTGVNLPVTDVVSG